MESGKINVLPAFSRGAYTQETTPLDNQAAKIARSKEEFGKILRKESERKAISKKQIESYLKEITHISSMFDRELRFSVNKELNEVIVKVVDSRTDKVIKEIPPEDIVKLHLRMKEVIGLLFDKEI